MMEHTIQVVNNITEAYKKVDSLITAKNYDAAKAAIDAISVNERKEFGPTRKALVDAGYDPAFLISV
ncbi:MAG: hypothetical protein H6766_07895 [Candidatus Peribacteria bacterium]|nr:MAG: hypothetical protein H6766_07895 [Candidatus Peribacteria bacterium]